MSPGDESKERLRERLESFFTDRIGSPATVSAMDRLSGGASREMWSATIASDEGTLRVVLRRDPPGAPARSDRRSEVAVLRAAHAAGVPVPTVLWTGDADELGSPGFVMEHVDGETIARRILREDEFAAARDVMAAQCGQILARVHATATDGLEGLVAPTKTASEDVLDQYEGLLDSLGEPHPAFELALRWLRRSPPPTDRVTLVHGDFRLGNFIVGPEGIRAVLDWEITHLGDPWEDLAWLCTRSWRFGAPGEVGGFGDRGELYQAYEEISGIPVDRDAVRWWEVMSSAKWGVMTIMQAFTHLWGHVSSLELAAIGRRTVECEYDVLGLIGARGVGSGGGAPPPDQPA